MFCLSVFSFFLSISGHFYFYPLRRFFKSIFNIGISHQKVFLESIFVFFPKYLFLTRTVLPCLVVLTCIANVFRTGFEE